MRTCLLGLAVIFTGIGGYEGWHRWASTRTWEPLNIPVSLSAGHIRSPEFEINTRSTYLIAFVAKNGFGHSPEPSESEGYVYCLPYLHTKWSLSHDGQIVARDAGQQCDSLGRFQASEGHYILDVDVSQDGGRFNMREPHLAIFEYGGELEAARALGQLAFWACVILTILGAGIIFRVVLGSWNGKAGSILSAWPLTYPQRSQLPFLVETAGAGRLKATHAGKLLSTECLMGDPRLSARQPFAGKSSFSLLTAIVFLLTFISITVLQSEEHRVATGLSVHLPRPVTSAVNLLGMQPVLVRVELTTSLRPQLYVDDQAIAWEDFRRDPSEEA